MKNAAFTIRTPIAEQAVPDTSPSSHLFEPGDVVGERFRIVRLLGQGGMGQVYQAEDTELGAAVALKVIRPEHSRKAVAVERFKREVHLARQVTHPNVCRIFDLFQHEGGRRRWHGHSGPLLFLTMELLEGENLAERLARAGPLSPAEALPLVREMAGALDAAHRAGVIHRDFKSSNVMLAESGAGVRAVVTDFGLARSYGEAELTDDLESAGVSHSGGGTPAYMAPELLLGENATVSSDVFSFGVTVFEMVTGTLPFRTSDSRLMARHRLEQTAPSPRELRPELDSVWEKALLRCLERDAGRRFRRAGDLAAELAGRTARLQVGWLAALASALAVLAVFATGVWLGGRPAASRPALAILGFKSLSPQANGVWLSTALAEMLAADMAAGEELRTIPGEHVERMRQELELAETETLSPDALRRVGAYLGADFLVLGSYFFEEDGDASRIQVNLSLRDAAAGETLAVFAERGTEARLSDLVHRTGSRLSGYLGLDPRSRAAAGAETATGMPATGLPATGLPATGMPATGMPATGLPATGLPGTSAGLRPYARGLARLRLRDYRGARELLERAARAEPESARIQSALAECWAGMGYDERAEDAARRALELAPGLSRRDRLLVEGGYAEAVRDWPRARRLYQSLWTVFPDEPDYGLRLAAVEVAAGDPLTALATVEELRRRFGPEPRIDLAEAEAARARADHERQLSAASRAARGAVDLGAELLQARAVLLEGEALQHLGRVEEAQARMTEVRRIYDSRGDRRSLAEALIHRYDLLRAEEAGLGLSWQDALEVFREVGDQRGVARVLVRYAKWKVQIDELAAAEAMLGEALDLARQLGSRGVEAEALNYQAVLAFFERDPERCLALFEEAADRARESGNLNLLAGILGNLGGLQADFLRFSEARKTYDEAVHLARRLKGGYVVAMNLVKAGRISREFGLLDLGEERCREALAIGRRIDHPRLVSISHGCLADLETERGAYRKALAAFSEAVVGRDFSTLKPGDDATLLGLIQVYSHQGEYSRAEELIGTAMAWYPDDELWSVGLQMRLADLRRRQRRVEEAQRLYETALRESLRHDLSPGSRLDFRLTGLRIAVAAGNAAALDEAETVVEEIAALGTVRLELASRLELGRALVVAGEADAGRAELAAVADQARRLGYGAVAREAARASEATLRGPENRNHRDAFSVSGSRDG